MKLHNIHTISTGDAQQVLLTNDYSLLIKRGRIFFSKKIKLRKIHANFINELNELFSSEDIKQRIDTSQMIQKFRLKIENLNRLELALSNVYMLKNTPDKIKVLDKLKAHYRMYLNRYPDIVDIEADTDTYNKQIEAVLKPIKNEVRRLTIKLKSISPEKSKTNNEESDNVGLLWAIQFVENVTERNYDMSRSVWQLKKDHDLAVMKYEKLKADGKN